MTKGVRMGTLDINCYLDVLDKIASGEIKLFSGNENGRLAELGKLTLQTELCHWGYQYNDGDCNEAKYPCVRNELCKMKWRCK